MHDYQVVVPSWYKVELAKASKIQGNPKVPGGKPKKVPETHQIDKEAKSFEGGNRKRCRKRHKIVRKPKVSRVEAEKGAGNATSS